jgi:hypothetical protein
MRSRTRPGEPPQTPMKEGSQQIDGTRPKQPKRSDSALQAGGRRFEPGTLHSLSAGESATEIVVDDFAFCFA